MTPNKEFRVMSEWGQELADAEGALPDEMDQTILRDRSAVRRALSLRRDVEAFEAKWAWPANGPMAPAFTWDQLERQLADLADTPMKSAMARDLVSATRKTAAFKPPEMVLREILCLTWALLDESFQPEFGSELGEGVADMP
jgi:hypothetical protein